MRVLVTGGAGFIGSNLVDRLLAEGHEVDVVDDLSTGTLANLADARGSGGAMRFHNIDVRSHDFVDLVAHRQPEVIYHLAAQADVRVSVDRPVFDAEVNILGTIQALEGARAAGGAKVVFAASGGTLYGEPDDTHIPVDEHQPHRPLSPYGVSKKSAIDYLVAYRELHGIEFSALALANVYGPRQDPHGEAGVVAIFSGNLLAGRQCVIFGDGSQTRDYVYVDDVVDAFAHRGTPGRRSRPEHRHREGDLGCGVVRDRGGGRRQRPCYRKPPPCDQVSCSGARSTRGGQACTSDGSPGPLWKRGSRPLSGTFAETIRDSCPLWRRRRRENARRSQGGDRSGRDHRHRQHR